MIYVQMYLKQEATSPEGKFAVVLASHLITSHHISCQIIGDHCCTLIPQGEGNLTIVVEHLKELSGDLANEHQQENDWSPFGDRFSRYLVL